MFGEFPPVVLTAQILFLLLSPLVLFAPVRWATLAWLLMGNLDATGPISSGSESIGWMNAVKGIGIPLFLLWRLRRFASESLHSPPMRLWMLLTSYALVASFWSPFPLGAAKLVGNMIGILLTFIVLEKAAREQLLTTQVLSTLIVGSIALGLVQTWLFGAYSYDGVGQPLRFSGFLSPQQYAAFLVAFWAIVLWDDHFRPVTRFALGLVTIAALAYNGSRTWFLGAAVVLLSFLWCSSKRVLSGALFTAATALLLVLFALNFDPYAEGPLENSSSRIVATVSALATGEDTPGRAGLGNLNFRMSIYDGVMEEFSQATTSQVFFGHGTSSGGTVIARVFPRYYTLDRLDPNRAIHNEWLRAAYEWGLLGLVVLVAVMATLSGSLLHFYRHGTSKLASAASLSFLPAFGLALSTENLIAGAGNAVTMSLALLVALNWTSTQSAGSPRQRMRTIDANRPAH